MDSRSVVFHVHVRKCGGSTFYQQILQRNFGRGFYRDASLIDDIYGIDQVNQILSHCPWLTAYSSHKITLDLPYDDPHVRIVAAAFVRDPVDRFLSQYFYLKHHPKGWDAAAQRFDLPAYIDHIEQRPDLQRLRQASQLQHLTGERGSVGLERLESYLPQRHLHLIPVSQFDAGCVFLERMYPALMKDCSYAATSNRSIMDEVPSEDDRARIERLIDAADHQLLAIANRRFQESLESHGLDSATMQTTLQDFKARCRRREKPGWFSRLGRKK